MKRDMDFIRQLLLDIEGGQYGFATLTDKEAGNYGLPSNPARPGDEESFRLRHHLKLLKEVGFVEFETPGQYDRSALWVVTGITWKGHDFLDSVRDPAIWAKTKDGAKAAGGFTVDLLGSLAKGFIKQKVMQHTGIEVEL